MVQTTHKLERRLPPTPWWLPYVTFLVLVGGWLVQYGYEKAEHRQLEATVRRLNEQQRVTNVINYSEHPRWWESILAAEKTQ